MKLRIEFELDNAAFAEDPWGEPARVLETVAAMVRDGEGPAVGDPVTLRDRNGNRVGFARLIPGRVYGVRA